jgi:uncharacterized protein YigE (DUF2233 family)
MMRLLGTLALLLPLAAAAPTGAIDWKQIDAGVETAETTIQPDAEAGSIPVFVVRIDPSRVRISVLDPVLAVREAGRASGAYSLREMLGIGTPHAVINGGFTGSFTYPIPTGLVRHAGDTRSPLNAASKTQSGVFCVRDGTPSILAKSEYRTESCDEALQSGPRVVELPGKNGIHRNEREGTLHERSIVAIDDSGQLLFVRSGPAHLFDLAELLLREEAAGGLDCAVALNLSGDLESGVGVHDPESGVELRGEVDVTIASAIGVFRREPVGVARRD